MRSNTTLRMTFAARWMSCFRYVLCVLICMGPAGCARKVDDALNLYLETDPATLDPALITDVAGGRISALLYDTLVRHDEHLRIQGALARSWTVSEDARRYTFQLREDAVFSSGQPVTASDVRFSFNRLVHPKTASGRAWIFSRVEGYSEVRSGRSDQLSGIRVLGPHEISVRLKEPFSPFLSMLSMPNASVLSESAAREGSLVGTGPFTVESWIHDYEMRLKAHPGYFAGSPKVPRIRYRIIKEKLFVSSEFLRGRLDIIELPGAEISLFKGDMRWKDRIVSQPNLSLYYLGFNLRKPPFDDLALRKAVAQAIDCSAFVEGLRKHRSVAVRGPVPPGVSGYDPDLNTPAYDLPAAVRTIQIHQDALPPKIVLLQSSSEETLELSEMIQHQLKKAGLEIQIEEQEWSAFKANLVLGNFDLFLVSWWADYPEGENFLFPLFHSSNIGSAGNYTGYADAETDRMIYQLQTAPSEQRRDALCRSVQERILQACPMVFLYSSESQILTQPWIMGYSPHPLYHGNKLTQVRKENVP